MLSPHTGQRGEAGQSVGQPLPRAVLAALAICVVPCHASSFPGLEEDEISLHHCRRHAGGI
jgi:hypothetical protein